MPGFMLLLLVTCLYAGYNLFVKQSSAIAETTAASTITATILLQFVALLLQAFSLSLSHISPHAPSESQAGLFGYFTEYIALGQIDFIAIELGAQ